MDLVDQMKEWQTLITGVVALIAGSFAFFATNMQIEEARRIHNETQRLQFAKDVQSFIDEFKGLQFSVYQYQEYENITMRTEEPTKALYASLVAYFGDSFFVVWEYLGAQMRILDNQIYHPNENPEEVFKQLQVSGKKIHEELLDYLAVCRLQHPADVRRRAHFKAALDRAKRWTKDALVRQGGWAGNTPMTDKFG